MKTMIAAMLLISSSAMATTNDTINIKVLSYCSDNRVVRETDDQIVLADDCEAKNLTCVDYVNQRGIFIRYAARCEAK
ncbi:hypothetical protein ACLVWU_01385 [Bdellovibrio sp. HCB290]|uniref:hypothetical protein n=1 Tax=Bdellovibrio sp. HCB290 TaxID=3394356 RepID=UPI0039B3789A